MAPLACMACTLASTSAPLIPTWRPTTAQGSGTSGRPAWVASTMARSRSSGVATAEDSDGQVETDMEFFLLGHVEDGQPGGGLDLGDHLGDTLGRLGGQHEPHVETVLAAVVVGHLGKGVHRLGDVLERLLRHCQGGQGYD